MNFKFKIIFLLVLIGIAVLGFVNEVSAFNLQADLLSQLAVEVSFVQNGGLPPPPNGGETGGFTATDLKIQDLERILHGLVCWVYRIAFLLIILFIVWSGIRYLSSGGSPERVTSAHQTFKWVVIGAVVILGVGVIISTIAYALGVSLPFPGLC